jgi:multimeric flavodoxin WrbA
MRALCLNCTLKHSPEPSNTESLAGVVLSALRDEGVETDEIRLVDQQIDPGVVSEAVTDGDQCAVAPLALPLDDHDAEATCRACWTARTRSSATRRST